MPHHGQRGGDNPLEGQTAYVGSDATKQDRDNYRLCDAVDDDVEIQWGIDYVNALGGGVVQLDHDDYNCLDAGYAPIQMRTGVTLRGVGMGATTLNFLNDNITTWRGAIENVNQAGATIDRYMVIEDLEMVGPGLTPAGGEVQLGVFFQGVQFSRVTRIKIGLFYGFCVRVLGDAPARGATSHVVLEECYCYSSVYNFSTFGAVEDGDLTRCIARDNFVTGTDTGISLFNAQECIVAHNILWDNNETSVFANSIDIAIEGNAGVETSHNIIMGNVCSESKAGIICNGGAAVMMCIIIGNTVRLTTGVACIGTGDNVNSRISIIGNTLDGNALSRGIYVRSPQCIVKGNIINNWKSDDAAISVQDGLESIVQGNIIGDDGGPYGISVNNGDYSLVKDNIITRTTGGGQGVYIQNSTQVVIDGNYLDDWLNAINLQASAVSTKIGLNHFGPAITNFINDGSTTTIFPAIPLTFVEGTTLITAAPFGWEIDAATEYAITFGDLPPWVNQLRQIRVKAVSHIIEADAMRLELEAYGGASNELYTQETIAVADKASETTNFVADDYVYWLFTPTDDADIDDLGGGDSIMIKVLHEIAGGGDAETHANFLTATLEYI